MLQSEKSAGWWEGGKARFLLALLIVAVLHLPFLFVPFPEEPERPAMKGPALKLVSLPAASSAAQLEEMPASGRELYEWLELANPVQWYFPDAEHGFSQYNRPEKEYSTPAWQEFALAASPLERYLFKQLKLSVPAPSLSELFRNNYHPFRMQEQPRLSVAPALPHAVVWRRAGGNPLKESPVLDAATLRSWDEPATRAAIVACTRFKVHFSSELALPRVVLRQSCGVPALDEGAARALRGYIGSRYRSALPAGNSAVELEVDWFF